MPGNKSEAFFCVFSVSVTLHERTVGRNEPFRFDRTQTLDQVCARGSPTVRVGIASVNWCGVHGR